MQKWIRPATNDDYQHLKQVDLTLQGHSTFNQEKPPFNQAQGLCKGMLKIATRNAKYRSAKNSTAINSISGYLPILVSP